MSADWIKMRCDLQTHPKIVRILSAICPQSVRNLSEMRPEKLRIVGALHAVWSVFDMHTVDGFLRGYTLEMMDDVIGLPGFSQAMVDVGWLAYDGPETLVMPDFESHNGKGAKRRAEDAKRKKSERANGAEKRPQSVRKMSEKNGTNFGPEKEKEKELTSTPPLKNTPPPGKSPAVAVVDFQKVLQDQGIPQQVAADWLTLRKAKRAAVTLSAIQGIEREAAKAGVSLTEALETCCTQGWTGFKAKWITNANGQNGTHRNGHDRDAGRRAAAVAIFGKAPETKHAHDIFDITPPTPRVLGR